MVFRAKTTYKTFKYKCLLCKGKVKTHSSRKRSHCLELAFHLLVLWKCNGVFTVMCWCCEQGATSCRTNGFVSNFNLAFYLLTLFINLYVQPTVFAMVVFFEFVAVGGCVCVFCCVVLCFVWLCFSLFCFVWLFLFFVACFLFVLCWLWCLLFSLGGVLGSGRFWTSAGPRFNLVLDLGRNGRGEERRGEERRGEERRGEERRGEERRGEERRGEERRGEERRGEERRGEERRGEERRGEERRGGERRGEERRGEERRGEERRGEERRGEERRGEERRGEERRGEERNCSSDVGGPLIQQLCHWVGLPLLWVT